jgi:hypothetical protein
VKNGRQIALGLAPLVLLLAAMVARAPEHKDTSAGQARAFEPSQRFRAVVFILDSAGRSEMFDPGLMPPEFVANVIALGAIASMRGQGDVSMYQKHLRRARGGDGDDAPGFFGIRFE